MELELRERYARLQAELAEVARAAGRSPDAVTVVGVTKHHSPQTLRAAVAAGMTDLGENYLQEAREKFDAARDALVAGRVRKHFIGHVQTNKAKGIAALFDLVQSVDRLEAGTALAKAARSLGKTLGVLLQVNVSPTERFGCDPAQAERLAEALRAQEGLRLEGVMAIGPLAAGEAEIARSFELAAKTFERVGGSTLSIGMSNDWRQAVRCGSTMIRIGTALFGQRVRPAPGLRAAPVRERQKV